MDYPDDICRLVIRHMDVVEEAPQVVEHVQKVLFCAIDGRIERHIKENGWQGVYGFFNDSTGGTYFAPQFWPKDNSEYKICYQLSWAEEASENTQMLSTAIGMQNAALSLDFWIDETWFELTGRENKKRLYDFYKEKKALRESGFHITKGGTIYRPFSFDATKLAEDYPNFDAALTPLDEALEDLFKAHAAAFHPYVQGFMQEKGRNKKL